MREWLRERRRRRLVRLIRDSEHERRKWGFSHTPSETAWHRRAEARWMRELERLGPPSEDWLDETGLG